LLVGLFASFFVPGTALCGRLPQSGIVWVIMATTLATGLGYCGAGWLIERRSSDHRLIDDLQLSGTLMIAAGLLWADVAAQSGPVRGRTPELWASLSIIVLTALVGVFLMHRRAMRLASLRAPDPQPRQCGNPTQLAPGASLPGASPDRPC
jgi:hypothetical protein